MEKRCSKYDKGRNLFSLSRPAVLAEILLSITPAFVSCTMAGTASEDPDIPVQIQLTRSAKGSLNSLDIFFFNNDPLQRLDAYQRIENCPASAVNGYSRSGEKRLALLANASGDKYTWSRIQSFPSLEGIRCRLDRENPASPVMSGTNTLQAGTDRFCPIALDPLLCRIVLGSISCDFHERPYKGASLENVKVYLTNVSASTPPFPDSEHSVMEELLNPGRLDSAAVAALSHPEMVFAELGQSVGLGLVSPDLELYCYPNNPAGDDLGAPPTRLVIEGELQGETYYYPITLADRKELPEGLVRGTTLRLDVTLTRRGTKDPDVPADPSSLNIRFEPQPWSEQPGQIIRF